MLTHGVPSRPRAAAILFMATGATWAQSDKTPPATVDPSADPRSLEQKVDALTQEVWDLKALVRQLQDQLAASNPPSTAAKAADVSPATVAAPAADGTAAAAYLTPGMTINALLDGYYEYNFNSPIGRVNGLRAYDVSSNSFSLNQADLVIERAADPSANQRLGLRLDLQFGQATSTLQGNPANEPRPDVYRNIFQAYGTYVFPVAAGLTVDFGKFASSLGIEGNYTQDQLNYSRSLWFDYLPFYHMGIRSKLAINDQWAVNAWIVNGSDQTEDFNNYKDQLLGIVYTPDPAISWTLNFYQGQEHPDVLNLQNASAQTPNSPNQQGTYFVPINNPPDGKLEIVDTYLTWQVTKALVLAAQADYVQQRFYSYSQVKHVDGGALYAGLQLSPVVAIAGRVEYLEDAGALFSGTSQHLKEETFTLDYRPVQGFLVRGELRSDQSNRRYFYADPIGVFRPSQTTLGVGLVWWLGQKQGPW